MLDMISIFLNLLRFAFLPNMWLILKNVASALEKTIFCCIGVEFSVYAYLLSSSGLRYLLFFNHYVMSNSLNPVDYSMPGTSVLHYLPEFAQIHVHWVGDAI